MTISYTNDVSKTNTKNVFKLLCRWRGSVWQATLGQLGVWMIAYMAISCVYRYAMPYKWQRYFEALAIYLDSGINSTIPLTFMLGFFVSFVVSRWTSILRGLGWIDDAAIVFATFIKEKDDESRLLKRNLIRYLVLNQALVLRDISMQVRKRFPTLDCLVTADLLTQDELARLMKVEDVYSQYWTPIQWVHGHLYKAHLAGKIKSEKVLDSLMKEVQKFRDGIASLLRYDWVPIPLVYPQVIFFAVRLYFAICLISRQFIIPEHTKNRDRVDLWIPFTTMLQFVVYMGWMKVAEALMNPLGEDDDDLECNYVIDKNLITGLTLVEQGAPEDLPDLTKDQFWDEKAIYPLYALEAAERSVHPLEGSASRVNLVKHKDFVKMIPNRTMLPDMTQEELDDKTRTVDVRNYNQQEAFKKLAGKRKEKVDPDSALRRIKLLSPCMNRKPQTKSVPCSETASLKNEDFKMPLRDIENGKH